MSATKTNGDETESVTASDTGRLRFSLRTKRQVYGDGEAFWEYRVVMHAAGKIVGVEDGPRRMHKNVSECRAAGWSRVKAIRTHRLFIVPVTKKDIDLGEARSCQSCAIAQALWRNQERIGLSKWEFDFRVEPYGFAVDCGGIVLENKRDYGAPELETGEHAMPIVVTEGRRGLYVESMYEWSSHWDDWAESRSMTAAEWREDHPDDGGKPYKPTPCSFVLDLSAMKPNEE